MKKIAFISSITIGLVISFVLVKSIKKISRNAQYIIGIVQTASHPALDAARDGFIEELKNKMADKVAFVVQNAQGSIAHAHALAQQFYTDPKFDAFFAIATPAAQAMSAVEKKKPIIIAAVTDPHALGLIYPNTNICGSKDMIDVKAELAMLEQLVPQVKKVGLLYTAGETNSIALVKKMKKELALRGLEALDFAVSNEADVHAAVELACRKADVILAPTDNSVASSIALIASTARKRKKPLIVSDNMLVKFGALAARGVDYHESGKEAARKAHAVLIEEKKPYELPFEQAKSEKIVINQKTLEILGLKVPESLKNQVILVGES